MLISCMLLSTVAEVRFERETYTVSEGDVVEVCVIKDLETAIPTAVDLETQDGTASSKENSYRDIIPRGQPHPKYKANSA